VCGIAGFIDASYNEDHASSVINTMCQVIRHRGPDEQGIWVGNGVALGMRRLAIIDRSLGHQPMLGFAVWDEDQKPGAGRLPGDKRCGELRHDRLVLRG
jgi:asparagine synthetase B (glutamine-hydrolysing)